MSALQNPVLVLNRNWQPVNVTTVARALILLWNDNARVVDSTDYQTFTWEDWASVDPKVGDKFIQSTSLKLRVPEIITLSSYSGLPETVVTFSRRNVFKRDHLTCQYCSKQPGMDELTIDHIVPRSKGGTTTWENCVLACIGCNKKKDDKTLKESGMKLRKQPVRPEWKPIYAHHSHRLDSWAKFVSEVYWNVELKK